MRFPNPFRLIYKTRLALRVPMDALWKILRDGLEEHTARRTQAFLLLGIVFTWLLWYALVFIWPHGETLQEQAVNGNLARGLVEGLAASPWSYQYQQWAHGSLVFGLLLTPVFYFGGSLFLWIKILGAIFAIAGAAVWLMIVYRAWGAWPAILFAVWWLLPPPLLGSMLHTTWANHMESILLSGLLIWMFLRIQKDSPSFLSSLGLGLAAGIFSFFCFQNLITSVALAVAALWRWRLKAVPRTLLPAAAGFVIGLYPHEIFVLTTGYETRLISSVSLSSILHRWGDLLVDVFPRAAGYSTGLLSVAMAALMGCAFLFILWEMRPRKKIMATESRNGTEAESQKSTWLSRVLGLYVVSYFVAYGIGTYYIQDPNSAYDYRYLLPLIPVGMAMTSVMLAGTPRRLGAILLIPFFVWGYRNAQPAQVLHQTIGALKAGNVGYYLMARRGDDYGNYVINNLPKSWKEPEAAFASVMKLPGSWRCDGFEEFGKWLGAEDATTFLGEQAGRIEDFTDCVARGASQAAAAKVRTNADEDALNQMYRDWLARLMAENGSWAAAFTEGLGMGLTASFTFAGEFEKNLRMSEGGGKPYLSSRPKSYWDVVEKTARICKGMGDMLPPHYHPAFARGVAHYRYMILPGIPGAEMMENEEKVLDLMHRFANLAMTHEVYEGYRSGMAQAWAFLLHRDNRRFDFQSVPLELPVIKKALKERKVELVGPFPGTLQYTLFEER